MRLPGGGCGSRSAWLLKLAGRDPAFYCVACFILHGLCDIMVICFHMLNITSDGNFLILEEKLLAIS